MKQVANSRFTITSWDEKPYSEGLQSHQRWSWRARQVR